MFEVYCLECDYHKRVDTLVEAGLLADAHDDGPHEAQIFHEASDRMVTSDARVAFEESLSSEDDGSNRLASVILSPFPIGAPEAK